MRQRRAIARCLSRIEPTYRIAMAVINPAEVEFSAIRAQGPGGQNVNKVSCAVHARFDIAASSLPAPIKERLLALRDARITGEGVLVLQALVDQAAIVPTVRRATRPTRGSQLRRLDGKTRSGQIKALRGKVSD